MADITFSDQITVVPTTWLQDVNNKVYRGGNPVYATSTGSANAYTVTLPGTSLYAVRVAGDSFRFKANFANTGAATLTVVGSTSLGPSSLVRRDGTALLPGDVSLNSLVDVTWTGSVWQLLNVSNLVVNVKDFGALGDGSTDDTTAWTNAVNAANALDATLSPATLRIPDGTYRLNTASLPTVHCNVFGPGAILKCFDDTQSPLITFDDNANGRYVELYSMVGPNFLTTWQTAANQKGVGLRVVRAEHSRFMVQKFEGLLAAVDFDGRIGNYHIGECTLTTHSIMHNNYGINLAAGNSQCEANRFEVAYFNNNLTNVLLTNGGSGGSSLCANNHFDILVMEFPSAGGVGFSLDGDVPAQTSANTFIVRENIAPNGTATVITDNAKSTLGANYFRFSDFDFSKMSLVSAQIFDGAAEFSHPGDTAYKARSATFGAAIPTAPYWQKGAVRYNNNPSLGDPVGWHCTTAGSPGTWMPFYHMQTGSWTPSPTNLTVVGTPTYTGRYTKIGQLVWIEIRIQSTTSTASTAGGGSATSFAGLPFVPSISTPCSFIKNNVGDVGLGQFDANTSRLYCPTWTADIEVVGAGFYVTL